MPPKLPAVSAKKLMGALARLGFGVVRTRGSHVVMKHPDGRRTVIPLHAKRDVPKGTLAAILKDISLSIDEIRSAL